MQDFKSAGLIKFCTEYLSFSYPFHLAACNASGISGAGGADLNRHLREGIPAHCIYTTPASRQLTRVGLPRRSPLRWASDQVEDRNRHKILAFEAGYALAPTLSLV